MSEAQKVEAALKELRKEDGNKTCFECGERGPSYVDMDHGTFVCSICGGILREFTFKVKGLSMSTFTLNEVKLLKQGGGNIGAKKVWLSRFEGDVPQPGDKDKIRTFIRDVFVLKKYKTKSKSDSESSESEEDKKPKKQQPPTKTVATKPTPNSTTKLKKKSSSDSESEEEEKPKKPKKPIVVTMKKKKHETSSEESSSSEDEKVHKKSVKKTEKATTKKAEPPSSANLLDIDFGNTITAPQQRFGFSTAFPTSSVVAAAAAPPPKQADPFDFGDFTASIPTANVVVSKETSHFNDFGSFVTPTAVSSSSTKPQQGGLDFFSAPPQMMAPQQQQSLLQNNPQMMQMMMSMMQQQQQHQQVPPPQISSNGNPFTQAKATNNPPAPSAPNMDDLFGSFN